MATTLESLLRTQVPEGGSLGVQQERYAYPDKARQLAGTGTDLQGQSSAELLELLSNPAAHPAYQRSLQGVLAGMRPQIEQGYQDLEDQFRQAGALQSGAYGTSLAKYAGEVNRNETIAASDVLSKLLPTLVQGYQAPALQAPSLLEALKLREGVNKSVSGGSSGAGSIPSGPVGVSYTAGAPSQAPRVQTNYAFGMGAPGSKQYY